MTINDLIQTLTDLRDQNGDDGDIDVRIAMQPSWPFEYSIGDVQLVNEDQDEEDENDGDEGGGTMIGVEDARPSARPDAKPPVVYLAEGSQLGYLPGHVTSMLGWGRR